MASKFKILFFGSDVFSIATLKPIVSNKQKYHLEVLTKPSSSLDEWAAKCNIKRNYWTKQGIRQCDFSVTPSIGFVSSFGALIDVQTVNYFDFGLFNVHPSLLPKYRGASPVQHAILNGDSYTGVTLIQIPPIEKFDVGDIIMQETVSIAHKEYASELALRLANNGANMCLKFMETYDELISEKKPQVSENVSYAKKLKPLQGLINFNTDSTTQVDRKVRAFTGYIDLYFLWAEKKVTVSNLVEVDEEDHHNVDRAWLQTCTGEDSKEFLHSGAMFFSRKMEALLFRCIDNRWIGFKCLKMEAKPVMSARDFYNGYVSGLEYSTCQ